MGKTLSKFTKIDDFVKKMAILSQIVKPKEDFGRVGVSGALRVRRLSAR